jgi:hypothetical protein
MRRDRRHQIGVMSRSVSSKAQRSVPRRRDLEIFMIDVHDAFAAFSQPSAALNLSGEVTG